MSDLISPGFIFSVAKIYFNSSPTLAVAVGYMWRTTTISEHFTSHQKEEYSALEAIASSHPENADAARSVTVCKCSQQDMGNEVKVNDLLMRIWESSNCLQFILRIRRLPIARRAECVKTTKDVWHIVRALRWLGVHRQSLHFCTLGATTKPVLKSWRKVSPVFLSWPTGGVVCEMDDGGIVVVALAAEVLIVRVWFYFRFLITPRLASPPPIVSWRRVISTWCILRRPRSTGRPRFVACMGRVQRETRNT